ncbi:MAG TPA: phytoene desaturase [Cytophagales bacterium]|nr:phytoene desaturase [Cytophagales bacterium]HAA21706.1 phytoene desaturase [Cytophagales bacterium]HAP60586.1 phytoene desaturase [Cytophagales bacterium]
MQSSQPDAKKVGIVGAGIAGIATAIRLACAGHQVEVFEGNTYPGGKLSEVQLNGYRFDAGPSLFTLPRLVEELFELAGEKVEDHFAYESLAITCHYFWEDGTFLKAFSDPEKFAHEVEAVLGEPSQHVEKALSRSATLYDYLGEMFMFRSMHKLDTWTNSDARRSYRNLHKMDFLRTMNRANESTFENPKLVQLFNRYATYNGSDPYQTPATLNIIPHLEFNIGAYFPKRGMHDITLSLVRLAERQGVIFHYGTPVEEIMVENKQASGIKVDGKEHRFDRVVSNMDVVNTYRKLLPSQSPPEKLLNQPKSSSALIFYWGINHSFPQLSLHNILFSEDYREEFDHIFRKGTIYHDPTVYINITSKYKADDAPEGAENWFTMINVPNNQGQDWDQLISDARERILDKVSRVLKYDVRSALEVEEYLDPRRIESKTSSSQGALYGNSSNNRYAAFLRHANFSKRIRGLYFCGGSVHPGGGIPLSLSSAKIVSEVFE